MLSSFHPVGQPDSMTRSYLVTLSLVAWPSDPCFSLIRLHDRSVLVYRPVHAGRIASLAWPLVLSFSSFRLFAHSVPVYPCTPAAASSLPWAIVPRVVTTYLCARSVPVYPCTLTASSSLAWRLLDDSVPVYLYTLAASSSCPLHTALLSAQSDCVLVVYQCTRAHSPHPP